MQSKTSAGGLSVSLGPLAIFFLLVPLISSAQTSPEPPFAEEGLVMTFHLVPVEYWDAPAGPYGHDLPAGTVRLFRQGTYRPEVSGKAGEPLYVPPGTWVWTAEAPGYVSTFTNVLRVGEDGPLDERDFTVPMTPACVVSLSEDRRWGTLDRLDVVSLDEAAVYPVLPAEDRELWIPQGSHLAYGVNRGGITGIGPIGFCRQNQRIELAPPEPPAPDRQSMLVSVGFPEALERESREELVVELQDPRIRADSPPRAPDAGFLQGDSLIAFFLDVPADHPYRLAARHPRLRSTAAPIAPSGGSVREIAVGPLLERRELQVSVDYQPAQEHDAEILELRYCGRERSGDIPMLLLDDCGEPLAEHDLEPGFQTYSFPDLDDGQYLVDALIDGELIPGLGQHVKPFLEPGSEAVPTAVGQLEEMHIHGNLLRGDVPVPGVVHLTPWNDQSDIPPRAFPTDERDEYHLFYFARYPRVLEIVHFPEELSDADPEELPGLYCCFQLSACSRDGACRTFNIHSAFTGEGRFDIELPGEEVVKVRAVDAVSGEPVQGASLLVQPSLAFHFVDGEVIWKEPAGVEPDALSLGADGETRWLPPEPGAHRVVVRAPEYRSESTTVDVPPGGSVSLDVQLERERFVQGAQLVFENGDPVANARFLAFDDDGDAVVRCHFPADGEGRAAPPEGCSRYTFVLIHPWAALQEISGRELTGSAYVEVRSRPPFPPRVRLVDPDGEPVRDAFVQLRLGDLTLTPNDLFVAATIDVPFRTSNAQGEIVLNGVDTDGLFDVEVSPWVPYEEQWLRLNGRQDGTVEMVVEREKRK